ncbi:MAG: LOG family protein, partial [Candidatus Dormibacteraceae bacterium]
SLTLAKTGKIEHFPIVLFGREYWSGLLSWMHEQALPHELVGDQDLGLLTITDDPEEAAELAIRVPPTPPSVGISPSD